MRKIAVIIYGTPGAGKGTQADMLARALGLIHFDMGAYIEQVVHDPENKNDKLIQRQRKFFDTGGICDPDWVAKIAAERIQILSGAGFGVVLSGSLRRLDETFGKGMENGSVKGAHRGLLQTLENEYGRKKIFFFFLKVRPQSSISRNSRRLICTVCGKPVLTKYLTFKPTSCPACGGRLRKRTLDNPKVIKERLNAFSRLTDPVLKELRRRGYRITEINGEPAPYIVHRDILAKLKRWL